MGKPWLHRSQQHRAVATRLGNFRGFSALPRRLKAPVPSWCQLLLSCAQSAAVSLFSRVLPRITAAVPEPRWQRANNSKEFHYLGREGMHARFCCSEAPEKLQDGGSIDFNTHRAKHHGRQRHKRLFSMHVPFVGWEGSYLASLLQISKAETEVVDLVSCTPGVHLHLDTFRWRDCESDPTADEIWGIV